MKVQELYNVVCIADDLYAMHAGVMLSSLLYHSTQPCRVFLFTTNMQEQNRQKLEETVKLHEGSQIHIMDVDIEKWDINKLSKGECIKAWNLIMYLKLLMPRILPHDIDRVLFLDVDMVINSDISDLYNIDFQNNVIVGCEDWKYCYIHKERLGLAQDDCYINSGVVMVNLSKWRTLDKINPVDVFMLNHKDKILNDQDAFALYFRGEVRYIDQKWNATTFYFERKPRIADKYLPILDEVRKSPKIIHFCEPIKPWFKECRHPYRKLYHKFLKQTPWKDFRYPSCKTHFGKPAWRYIAKHWLNLLGLRHDDWSMIKL